MRGERARAMQGWGCRRWAPWYASAGIQVNRHPRTTRRAPMSTGSHLNGNSGRLASGRQASEVGSMSIQVGRHSGRRAYWDGSAAIYVVWQASGDGLTGIQVDGHLSSRALESTGIRSTGIRGRVDELPGRQEFTSTGILGRLGGHLHT